MPINPTVIGMLVELLEHARLEWIIRRRPQATGGQQPSQRQVPTPRILGILAEESFAGRRDEVSDWLKGLSRARIEYLEGAPEATLKNIFALSREEREKALVTAPKSPWDVLKGSKASLEKVAPKIPKTRARWRGYAECHGHEARQEREKTAREVGPNGLPDLAQNAMRDFKEGVKFRKPKGMSLWQEFLEGLRGKKEGD